MSKIVSSFTSDTRFNDVLVHRFVINIMVETNMWPEWPHPLSLYRCVPRGPADPDWTMPDALYRGRAGCSSLRGVVELVVVLTVVLTSLPSDELLNTYNAVVLPIVIVNP